MKELNLSTYAKVITRRLCGYFMMQKCTDKTTEKLDLVIITSCTLFLCRNVCNAMYFLSCLAVFGSASWFANMFFRVFCG